MQTQDKACLGAGGHGELGKALRCHRVPPVPPAQPRATSRDTAGMALPHPCAAPAIPEEEIPPCPPPKTRLSSSRTHVQPPLAGKINSLLFPRQKLLSRSTIVPWSKFFTFLSERLCSLPWTLRAGKHSTGSLEDKPQKDQNSPFANTQPPGLLGVLSSLGSHKMFWNWADTAGPLRPGGGEIEQKIQNTSPFHSTFLVHSITCSIMLPISEPQWG